MKKYCQTIILVFLLLLCISCNMTGYNDLGEPVNRFDQFGTKSSSFMCTQKTRNNTTVELFTISNGNKNSGNCSWLQVSVDSLEINVELFTGTYTILNDTIYNLFSIQYINSYKEKLNPSSFPGAVQNELSPKVNEQWTWHHDDSLGIVRMNDKQYKSIAFIYDAILSKTAANWPEQLLKTYLLCTMSAHCRIEGFGGIGMLQYIGKNTIFNGLIDGSLDFRIDGLFEVTSQFSYINHIDISGMTLNGIMKNQSNMSGNGKMEGIVTFQVEGISNTCQCQIDYSNIEITHTLPVAGDYILTIDGGDYLLDHDYGNPGNFDLTDILDPDPEKW